MEKNRSPKKSKRTWACPAKCDLNKGPCKHLEELLPHPERGSNRQVKLLYTDKVEFLGNEEFQDGPYAVVGAGQDEIDRFITKVKEYGLPEHQILILLDKFVHNKTIAEITKDRGFTSPGIVFYLYKKAIEILRERGFKL